MTGRDRACVYTCLIGHYEKLNEQPIAAQSEVPFLCLTDDAELTSQTWRIVRVEPVFKRDPVRSQRMLKLLPHRYLPEFDRSLYIDNTIVLSVPPEDIFARYFGSTVFALPGHSYRERVLDEFVAVAADTLDDEARLSEQLAHYQAVDARVLQEQPYWTGLMMRDHRDAQVRDALGDWAAHVLRYSRRDQLSVNYALRRAGLAPTRIEVDNYKSWFHQWPVGIERRRDARIFDRDKASAIEAEALHALAQELEAVRAELAEHKRTLHNVASSRSWRFTAPLRAIRKRLATPAPDFVVGPYGHRIYVDRRDQRAEALIAANGNFNPAGLAMWRMLVAERAWTHIVDVGANYGEMLVGAAFLPTSRLLAIEPNPYVLPYLERTIQEAGLSAELVRAAASDRDGTITLTIDRTWSGMSGVVAGLPQSDGHVVETRQVEARTLATLVRERYESVVSLLVKIDVEGHETAVLRGLVALLPDLEHFAALIEIMHLPDGDLDWLLERFTIALLEQSTTSLVTLDATCAGDLRAAFADGRFSPQDAVLRRR